MHRRKVTKNKIAKKKHADKKDKAIKWKPKMIHHDHKKL